MHAGLVYNGANKDAIELATHVAGRLKKEGVHVKTLTEQALAGTEPAPEETFSRGISLMVVIGGDGTLLRSAQLVESEEVSVLGVKLGGLGFLTEVRPEELDQVLDQARRGEAATMERMMLQARVIKENGAETMRALNEIAVAHYIQPKVIELDTTINGVSVTSFRADGLLVSTPTGTTAYCMAAGGPIVHPGTSCMTITPVCPHTLTSRPLVIPGESTVSVRLAGQADQVHVYADFQLSQPMGPGERVEIRRAQTGIRLVCSPSMNYYEILRTKLRWGER